MTSKEMKCPFSNVLVEEEKCGWEVSLFLHCHLRGYDEHGEGKFTDTEYFDKYGSPVHSENSWEEGYHQIEKRLADYYEKMVENKLDFPFIAGLGGAAHLYKPLHNNKPWNWTGWIPLQRRLYSQNKFFKNRYFLGIRGNEIQNNLWDYHPYEEEKEDFCDHDFSQVEPNDRYRGGYWFYRQAFGRYLHIIALKSHDADPKTDKWRRYNYIVHPLAYRAAIDTIPDNSVDAMQWCIINMPEEEHFGKDEPWGEKCHGLEIFNDFTYFHSYHPNEKGPCNGELAKKHPNDQQNKYYFWFNTYPLEFAEFMLNSALARGSYFHTIAANDAYFDRNVEHFASTDPKGGVHRYHKQHTKEKPASAGVETAEEVDFASTDQSGGVHRYHKEYVQQEDMVSSSEEKMEKREDHFSSDVEVRKVSIREIEIEEVDFASTDPNGGIHRYHKEYVQQEDMVSSSEEKMEKREDVEVLKVSFSEMGIDKEKKKDNTPLVDRLPYKKKTVFGFVTLFDTQERIKHVVCKQHDGLSCMGLDEAGNIALDYLIEGRYYSSTGIHDLFHCNLNHPLPYTIYDQPDPQQICYDIGKLEMVFTFLRIKEKNANLVWRYTIMIEKLHAENKLETIHGYFKLSNKGQTNLDLRCYEKSRVKWLYFTAIRPSNPQHRAWFHAIRGPAFGQPHLHAWLPPLEHHVESTHREGSLVIPATRITPTRVETNNLDFWLKTTKNKHDIYVYSMQVCPHQQNLTGEKVNEKIRESSDLIPPRILQSVHGYFNLRTDHPTRLKLCASWDSKTLKNGEVLFYIVGGKTGDPQPIRNSEKPEVHLEITTKSA